MKTRLRVLLCALGMAPVLLIGTTFAHEGETNSASPGSDKVSAQATTEQTSGDAKLTLQQRLDKRKTELKTKLTALEQQRIQSKCKASQGVTSSLNGRINGIETSRNNVHKELVERLTNLSAKLKDRGVDTTKLDSEIETLNTKIATFKTDLEAYKLAVADLSSMDCAKDPTAFKASLEAGRTARAKVAADAQDIRKYVKDTIKPTLAELKQQVEKKESEGNQ